MKKLLYTLLAAVALAFGTGAQAADPLLVKGTDGSLFGAEPVIYVAKNTDSGNRTYIRRANGTEAFVADDATWSKHGKFAASFGAHAVAAAPSVTINTSLGQVSGVVFDQSKIGTSPAPCTSNTIINWATGQVTVTLNDACAVYNTMSAAAQ